MKDQAARIRQALSLDEFHLRVAVAILSGVDPIEESALVASLAGVSTTRAVETIESLFAADMINSDGEVVDELRSVIAERLMKKKRLRQPKPTQAVESESI